MSLLKRESLHPNAVKILDALHVENNSPPLSNSRVAQFMDDHSDQLDADGEEMIEMMLRQAGP